jgi:hypothetical protein
MGDVPSRADVLLRVCGGRRSDLGIAASEALFIALIPSGVAIHRRSPIHIPFMARSLRVGSFMSEDAAAR